MQLQAIPKVTLIVAYSRNRVIGNDQSIPWTLKNDMKHFRKVTEGNVVIMGRNTWNSLPNRPLKNRTNVLISSKCGLEITDALLFRNLTDALTYHNHLEEVYVIGGGMLYEEAIPLASKIIATEIDEEIEGDVIFPELDTSYWNVQSSESLEITELDGYFKTVDGNKVRCGINKADIVTYTQSV